MTLHELQDLIAASRASHWKLLLPDAQDGDPDVRPPTRAVLRPDIDVALEWGRRESDLDYYEPWLGNFARRGATVPVERILLDVLYRGAVVDRLRGLRVGDAEARIFDTPTGELMLPFPRSRTPRVRGLADRFFPQAEATVWSLVNELECEGESPFERAVFRSGVGVE
ncbi:MAG: hypothetical protein ITG02_00950 [Patulibacter sp.]|nr:hypothetical protein [Patulibacter sp.]